MSAGPTCYACSPCLRGPWSWRALWWPREAQLAMAVCRCRSRGPLCGRHLRSSILDGPDGLALQHDGDCDIKNVLHAQICIACRHCQGSLKVFFHCLLDTCYVSIQMALQGLTLPLELKCRTSWRLSRMSLEPGIVCTQR